MHEENDLDRLIGAALATYAEPEPDPDLAGRILSRVAHESAPSPRLRWLPWALALPAVLCLILLFQPGLKTAKPRAGQAKQAAQLHIPGAGSAGPLSPPGMRHGATRSIKPFARAPRAIPAALPQPLPKLAVFPTPEPLTPQERALAVFAAHAPLPEQQALAQSEQELTPLTVASIHVLDLEPPDEGAN